MTEDEEALVEKIEDGLVCSICNGSFREEYGYPIACEDCGGEGVIAPPRPVDD